MLTNEELALKIQQGDDGLLPELWEQVRKFIVLKANSFYQCYSKNPRFEIDDLIQSAYFAVLYAVKSYDPSRGFKFITYLNFPIKTAFAEVAGMKTSKRDALMNAISLDAPAGTEADSPLLNAIGDKSLNYDIDSLIIESVFNQQLRAALDKAMEVLTDKQREILELYYYFGLTLERIAEIRECSKQAVDNQRHEAFSRIKHSPHRRKLAKFYYYRVPRDLYKRTGLRSWKETGCSQQEQFLIGWRKSDERTTIPGTEQQYSDCDGDDQRNRELATCCAPEQD
mgnify:CR=1 FL=1